MIISVSTQKGGVGKSSTVISIASGLVREFGKKVLIVDTDPQANTSKVLLPDYQKLKTSDTIVSTIIPVDESGNDDLGLQTIPIHSTSIPGLDILPSHISLAVADIRLTMALDDRVQRLKTALSAVISLYDHIILDSPPSLGWLTLNNLTAADAVLVPISPGYFELDSIGQLNKTIDSVRKTSNPNLQLLGYLFTMSDPTNSSKASLQILRQTYGNSVFNAVVPRNVDLRDASFNRKDIFEFSPTSASANAYRKLIKEIFNYE